MAGRQKRPKTRKDIGPSAPLLYRFALKPHAQERPRSKLSKTNTIYHFTPKKTFKYEQLINDQANEQHFIFEPFTCDLCVIINFRFPHRRHGDIDNMVKSILDGMAPKYKNGEMIRRGVFRNDKAIKRLVVEVFYEPDSLASSEVIVKRHENREWSSRLRVDILSLWEHVADWLLSEESAPWR